MLYVGLRRPGRYHETNGRGQCHSILGAVQGKGSTHVLDRFVFFFYYTLTRKQVDELQTAFFCKISGANGLKT